MKLPGKSIIFAAVLAAPLIASAGIKSSNTEEVSVKVSYSGYDLRTTAGKQMIERKIKQAAQEICGATNYTQSRSLKQVSHSKTCYQDAVQDAMNGLDKLTATSGTASDSTES